MITGGSISSCRVLNQCCVGVIVPLISTSMYVIMIEYTVDGAPVLQWWLVLFLVIQYAPPKKKFFGMKMVYQSFHYG